MKEFTSTVVNTLLFCMLKVLITARGTRREDGSGERSVAASILLSSVM